MFEAELVVGSALCTCLLLKTDHSTLSAIAIHFSQNATAELFELLARAELLSFLLTVILGWLREPGAISSRAYPSAQAE